MQNLGKRLKALRNEQGLILAQLGQQVGLSASYLSQIERSVTMPSLSRLATIARVLDVEVGHFFEDDVSSPCVVRLSQGKKLDGATGITVELLSADPSDKGIQPYRVVCRPGASRDQPPTHPGEEFGFVLKGQLTVTVGEETLCIGDWGQHSLSNASAPLLAKRRRRRVHRYMGRLASHFRGWV